MSRRYLVATAMAAVSVLAVGRLVSPAPEPVKPEPFHASAHCLLEDCSDARSELPHRYVEVDGRLRLAADRHR